MNDKENSKTSKFLSLILRHAPETIHLNLNENGWAIIEELITKSRTIGINLDIETLKFIVDTNDKKRFEFDKDFTKIRACQGHSIDVELNLEKTTPSGFLYHGTVEKFINSIKEQGLQKMDRQFVHLSKDIETATAVAKRRGLPIVLTIDAMQLHNDGFEIYLSSNGVWLINEVPIKYIKF